MTTSEGRAVEVEKALEYIAKWKAEYPRIVQPEKWQAPIIALGEEYEILRVRVADLTPLARLGEWTLNRIRGVYAGDVDAFDVQDKATEFGVIASVSAPKPCGECCVCEEVDSDTCYRDTEATTRARTALAAAGDDTICDYWKPIKTGSIALPCSCEKNCDDTTTNNTEN